MQCFFSSSDQGILHIGKAWLALLLFSAASLPIQAADHVLVPGFERFYADEKAAAGLGGRLLLGELNCTSCHQLESPTSAAVFPKQAPILDGVGSRVRVAWLKSFLADPQQAKPGTTMPNLFAAVPASERDRQVEALVHFLASLGGPAEAAPAKQSVARGEKLFHSIGCTACHDPRKENARPLATSVPLGTLSNKYAIPGLMAFLADPLKVRPSGRMPNLNLTSEESRDIASYLLKDLNVAQIANTRYSYYEGSWDKVPDFGKLEAKETGITSGFDVAAAPRRDAFGMRFESFLKITTEGEYTFHVGSDDGSRVLIDGKQAAAADGIHSFAFGSGKTRLAPGWHEIVVDYFEVGGDEELRVEFEGPGIARQPIEYFISTTKGEGQKPERESQFVADAKLAEKGREIFAKVGCASCHQLQQGGQTIPASVKATALARLKTGGCLADAPGAGLPKYALSVRQRLALAAALESLRKPSERALEPTQLIAHTMTAFNCYACHEREKVGGAEESRNDYFLSNMKEMGDEGRIPPTLTGAGAKLKDSWLKEIFNAGTKDRPYMFTRMPKFGEANVGHLVAALEKADEGKPDRTLDYGARVNSVKNAGWQLVGDKMLSCIKCHTFNNEKATGIQAISLTTMHKRLRDDWFHKYMLDPQVFRPGTRMPTPWPGGQTFYPKLLDGQTETQINAVWAYLSDGPKARLPMGIGRTPIELVPQNEAIVYRNFIEGSGPRAIGVGYPEKVNLAFDASAVQIAMLWKGAFIDASKHWGDRGAGYQPPLGDNVIRPHGGVPLAILAQGTAAWPTAAAKEQGYQFRGYRLGDARRPTFLYSLGDIQIEDSPAPLVEGEKVGFRRTFTLTLETSTENLWFRAAAASKIEQAGGLFVVNDQWRIKLDAGGDKPALRQSGKNVELLVPVKFKAGKAAVTIEYRW